MTLNLTLALPILRPLPFESEHLQLQDEALKELQMLGTVSPINKTNNYSNINIRIVDTPSQEPLIAKIWKAPHSSREYKFLILESDARIHAEQLRQEIKNSRTEEPSEEEVFAIIELCTLSDLQFEADTLLLLSNIVYPGSISVTDGHAFIGKKKCGNTTPFFSNLLLSAVETSRQVGWPKLSRPKFLQAWKWLKDSNALIDGVGVGRLGRALAAISHTTTSDLTINSVTLVWILLGLEALYTSGKVALKDQLVKKSEVILGPRTENKKSFGAVYDFRSKFLHGGIDLPLRFTPFDAVEQYEDFYSELAKSEGLALAVLLATFQWMILNDTTELNFEYALSRV